MHLSIKSVYWDLPGGLVVKSLPFSAEDAGSIPGWRAKIPHASQPKKQNIKQMQQCNKFKRDFIFPNMY